MVHISTLDNNLEEDDGDFTSSGTDLDEEDSSGDGRALICLALYMQWEGYHEHIYDVGGRPAGQDLCAFINLTFIAWRAIIDHRHTCGERRPFIFLTPF